MQASLDRQRLFGAIAVGGVVLLSTPMFWQHTVGYFDSGTQEKLNEFVSFPAGLVSAIFGLLWFRDARSGANNSAISSAGYYFA